MSFVYNVGKELEAMSQEWFFSKNGNNDGPCSLEQLKLMVENGVLLEDDDVFNPNFNCWDKVRNINELNSALILRGLPAVDYSSVLSRFNLAKKNDKNFNSTSQFINFQDKIKDFMIKIKHFAFTTVSKILEEFDKLPANSKAFVNALAFCWLIIAFLTLGLVSYNSLWVWMVKAILVGFCGFVSAFQMIQFKILPYNYNVNLLRNSAVLGLFLGLFFASFLNGAFSILWFYVSAFLSFVGLLFFLNKNNRNAVLCFSISCVALLFTFCLPLFFFRTSELPSSTLGGSSLESKIIGKWKKGETGAVMVEFTPGGTMIFRNITRKYQIKLGKIEIMYSYFNGVDETISFDRYSDDEIIFVSSDNYGEFSELSGRFFRDLR